MIAVQELEDRKRIRDLLSVSQPIQEDITFFRGSKPERTRYYPLRRSDSVSGPETMIVGPSKGKKGSSQACLTPVIIPLLQVEKKSGWQQS